MRISDWSSDVCSSDLPHHPGDTLGCPRSRIPAPNPMNYRHAFHAGNHADVLKHVALLALCDALVDKPQECYALDTHDGRGPYPLDSSSARRTGEEDDAIGRLLAERPRESTDERRSGTEGYARIDLGGRRAI